jgi:hypothetical protein
MTCRVLFSGSYPKEVIRDMHDFVYVCAHMNGCRLGNVQNACTPGTAESDGDVLARPDGQRRAGVVAWATLTLSFCDLAMSVTNRHARCVAVISSRACGFYS